MIHWETCKLTICITPLSGHDDRRGGWVCDRPSEQGEETRRQQQHVGRRAQETPLHVAPAASGQGLHPSSNTPCQPSTDSRWDLYWDYDTETVQTLIGFQFSVTLCDFGVEASSADTVPLNHSGLGPCGIASGTQCSSLHCKILLYAVPNVLQRFSVWQEMWFIL